MRFCFILEEKYVHKPMPTAVIEQLWQWGHEVDVLQAEEISVSIVTCLSLLAPDCYD